MSVIDKIKELLEFSHYTKQEQIIVGVQHAIEDKIIAYGDLLPSVNKLAEELNMARETIVKAYSSLKDRGIIESKHGVGYFLTTTTSIQKLSIALILYSFNSFQEEFYKIFHKTLGENYNIDVFFHHNNLDIYQSIFSQIKGKYGYFVVAPIQGKSKKELGIKLPGNKTLVIDRYENFGSKASYITQEFEKATDRILTDLLSTIKKFENVILFYKEDSDHPKDIKKSFESFCQTNTIKYNIAEEYLPHSVSKNTIYITINDSDLWSILRDCKFQQLKLGEDVGILSHNDTPVKEIYEDGISTISTDFKKMALLAAEHIINRNKVEMIVDTKLFRRSSL